MPADFEQLLSQRNLQATRDLIEGLGQRFQAWRNARVGLKGALLYVLPSPLAFTAVIELAKGQWDVALASAGAFLAIVFGARHQPGGHSRGHPGARHGATRRRRACP